MEVIILLLFIVAALFNKRFASSILLICALGLIYYRYYLDFSGALNYNFINSSLLMISLYGISSIFMKSDIPKYVLNFLLEKVGSYKGIIILFCTFSYIFSLFVDINILLVFLLPFILEFSKKINFDSLWIVVPSTICALLGSFSSLMGSNASIMFAGYLDLNFADFLFYDGRIGLFIISLVLFFITLFSVNIMFKDDKYYIGEDNVSVIKDFFPLYLIILTVLVLIISSIINLPYLSGILCLAVLIYGCTHYKTSNYLLNDNIGNVFLYLFMVLVIYNIKDLEVINVISNFLTKINNGTILFLITFISSIIFGFLFNQTFIFYLLMIILTKTYMKVDVNMMSLVYSTYLGLNIGNIFKKIDKYENFKRFILFVLLFVTICSYLIITFLYF